MARAVVGIGHPRTSLFQKEDACGKRTGGLGEVSLRGVTEGARGVIHPLPWLMVRNAGRLADT